MRCSSGGYTLNAEHRAADAVSAAGGPTADADLDRINLAMRLNDEDQIHIPAVGSSGIGTVQPTGAHASTSSGKLNVNTATVEELESLPGIGNSKAAAIVEYRHTHGPFERVEDLVESAASETGFWVRSGISSKCDDRRVVRRHTFRGGCNAAGTRE